MGLLTSNRELRPHNIWNWSIPAWHTRLPDGTLFKTCPNAGVCAKLCYARNGTYLFRNVRAAHDRNLQMVLNDKDAWMQAMNDELALPKFHRRKPRQLPEPIHIDDLDEWMRSWVFNGKAAIRIHDAGDFFAEWYLRAWIEIAKQNPSLLFYAYTKEVVMFKQMRHSFPINFRWLFSTGGLQDHEIGVHRHADVFPDRQAMAKHGYSSQDSNDLLSIMLPTQRIGITANNIRHYKKRMAGRTFAEMQK